MRLNDDSAKLAAFGLYKRLPYHSSLAAMQGGALTGNTRAEGRGAEEVGLGLDGRCA